MLIVLPVNYNMGIVIGYARNYQSEKCLAFVRGGGFERKNVFVQGFKGNAGILVTHRLYIYTGFERIYLRLQRLEAGFN